MTFAALAIVTCERPHGVSYLATTAEALLREGAEACALRYVVSDGPLSQSPAGYAVSSHEGEPEGSRRTMWRAFRYALEAGVDRLVYCEDDVEPSRGAVQRILRTPIDDDAAFVDFHDTSRLRNVTRPGLYSLRLGRTAHPYWGTQCMAFPRRTLEWLVERDPCGVWTQGLPHCADLALGLLLASSPWPRYVAHLPCLVRHVGSVSAAHRGVALGPTRQPTHFVEADAGVR